MRCQDVMLTLLFKAHEDTPAVTCAKMMRDELLGFLPVVNRKGEVVGVITDRDLAVRILADQKPPSTPAAAIMTPGPLLTCEPDEPLHSLERRMGMEKKSRALVQSHDGKLLGIISLSDIAQAERSASRTGKLMRDVTRREAAAIARP